MLDRKYLIDFLDNYLNISKFSDSTYNGLQIEGKQTIENICFAVDSSLDTFQKAFDKNCDLLIVHHGLIWNGLKNILGSVKERIAFLLKNQINLYVSHLPLDYHPEIGNNIQILKTLKANPKEPRLSSFYIGEYQHPLSQKLWLENIKNLINPQYKLMNFHSGPIQQFAVSSGSFNLSMLDEAIQSGIKTILTGEPSGQSMFYYPAKENQLNIIFAGHYETETFGLKALKDVIFNYFRNDLSLAFIDLPTGW